MRVTSFAALVVAGFGAFVLAAGCGSTRPRDLADAPGTSSGVSPGDQFDTDATAPQTCAQTADQGVCGCLDLTLLTDVPNIYFVLDRSGSMTEDDKWTSVRIVVADMVRRLGPRARFGAALFPGRDGDCSPGVEVMPMRAGDTPAGTVGPTTLALLSLTNEPATGGTPTAATLRALSPALKVLPGRTFVILATDGGPNCNTGVACGVDGCQANIEGLSPQCQPTGPTNCCTTATGGYRGCLDSTALLSAVSDLKAASVPTYIVGVPGTAPYGSLLDAAAVAGGTARDASPKYYNVDSTERDALSAALAKVAAKITATCDLPLTQLPDPTRVNVYLDDVVVPQEPVDGWMIDGLTVRLVGATCTRVLAGEALNVRVVAGCPTVIPK